MSYGVKLDPRPIGPGLTVRDLVDHHLYAYNAARLREACQLFARKIAQPDVTIGVTLSGALTPTGLGTAAIVPLIRAGLVDWVVSTGANLYHDMHRSLGFELFGTTPFTDDRDLREKHIIRIYDILFDQDRRASWRFRPSMCRSSPPRTSAACRCTPLAPATRPSA